MINISTSHTEGVYFYMLFCLAAIVVIIAGAGLAARKSSYSFRELVFMVCVGVPSAIIGSKLVLLDGSQWWSMFSEGHLPVENGKSIAGAILGVMLGGWAAGRICGKKESVLDLMAISFPLGMAVQRFGCLLAGCCHGNMTSMPWGMTYGPGSKPFLEQQQLGIIPADAATSLAVHPDQLYSILACMIIAIIAWRSGSRWKSPSAKFIFTIILYLAFRFGEQFLRFELHPVQWMGLHIEQWKVLSILILLSVILFFRERKYAHSPVWIQEHNTMDAGYNLKIILVSVFTMVIALYIGSWLTSDERTIMMVTVFPLCTFLILDIFLRKVVSPMYIRTSCLLLFALVLMSQKADIPGDTPKSYTTFNVNSAFGRFNSDHKFNQRTETGYDCDGNAFKYITSDNVNYKHTYKVGGFGIGRKVYYNQWRSLMTSLNIFMGREKETPLNVSGSTFVAPDFKNTLWSINPMIQYDTRGIGLGIGGSFGMLGHDIEDDPDNDNDYDPKSDARKFSVQTRLRLFSERFSFVEFLGGYDVGAVGEYNWQLLYGTRFNSDKYLLKAGFAWTKQGGHAIVVNGQIKLAPKLFISPSVMLGYKSGAYEPDYRHGNRMALSIEYRINDKKHK